MNPTSRFGADADSRLEVLWEDGERVVCRSSAKGGRSAVLAVLPAAEHPSPAILDRLAHEYGLKDELDGAWAVRPLELERDRDRPMLVLEDPGGELLVRRLIEVAREQRNLLEISCLGMMRQIPYLHILRHSLS